MKKLALILTFVLATTSFTAFADIQSPPGSRDNRVRKLSRGLSNMIYGITELPASWRKSNMREGSTVAAGHGIVNGAKRSVVRMGFGLYEVVTFPFATYKDGFKSPIPKKLKWDVNHGYSDYPSELGFQSVYDYGRTQPY
ncbi:MAG: putative exosortase-associated protein (TIGR04073 family) [Verrucomicrobiales bacterium]|jgi:putative exosortase-associated protein (TIGR04073 family)